LEVECKRSFLSSGGKEVVALWKLCLHMTYVLSSLRPALTRTLFPTPQWSNHAQALLRVTIYAASHSATLRYFLVPSLGRSPPDTTVCVRLLSLEPPMSDLTWGSAS
jgi:hypothetical protein